MDSIHHPVRIGVTLGDPNGIGPEVVAKAVGPVLEDPSIRLVVIGPVSPFDRLLGREIPTFDLLPADLPALSHLVAGKATDRLTTGTIQAEAGGLAMDAVSRACDLSIGGELDAMVTAPISKEAVQLAGYDIPGHTEFLAARSDSGRYAMMMVAGGLRVAVATTHVPISAVASLITADLINEKLGIMRESLVRDFGLNDPLIAVLGLNPHAGDGGVIGREEQDVMIPALATARESGVRVEGPHPADGFFASGAHEKVDAILAPYHDQGLVAFKILSFNRGTNFTAGLPFVRTSPDHGTAFDIAGQNQAVPDSMIQAIRVAADVHRNRTRKA